MTASGTAKAANAEFAVATGEASAGSQGSPKLHRPEGVPARRDGTISTCRLPSSADGRSPRPRSVADGSSSDPIAASVATEAGGAAGSTAASLMHPPEGGPSEGTGHGSGRATGGTGFGPFGHPAKRRWAFSEACGCSRTARRHVRRFDRAPTCGACIRAGAGRLPQGTCRKAGCWQAREPPQRFISRAGFRCCAFRSARGETPNFHLPGIPANAVGGGWNERSADSVTRTREVRAVVVPKGMRQPVGWVRSFPPHIPPTGLDRASTAARTSASPRPSRAGRTLPADGASGCWGGAAMAGA